LCEDLRIRHGQGIAWSRWLGPAYFAPGANDAARKRQAGLDQKAHSDRGRVPATRDKFSEKRALGRLLIEVKRLRIELTRKCLYLGRVDDMRSAYEALTHNQIVEMELFV
jgi:hypothetical protein